MKEIGKMTTYDDAFAALMAKVERNPRAKKAFAEDPVSALKAAGIPLVPALEIPLESQGFTLSAFKPEDLRIAAEPMTLGKPVLAAARHVTVGTRWWGIDIRMDQQITRDFVDGITPAAALGPIIAGALVTAGALSGGIATIVGGGVSLVIAAKVAQVKITNRGKGVHWPITWLQWAGLLAVVPLGPGGWAGAAIVLFHPLRN
jgi:hypothetical protein